MDDGYDYNDFPTINSAIIQIHSNNTFQLFMTGQGYCSKSGANFILSIKETHYIGEIRDKEETAGVRCTQVAQVEL